MGGIATMHAVVLECPDPAALADFYSRLLGWPVIRSEGDWATVRASVLSERWPRWPRSCDTRQRAELFVGERQYLNEQPAGRVARGRPGCVSADATLCEPLGVQASCAGESKRCRSSR